MKKLTQKERAQNYFERNTKVNELFGTSDGYLFERSKDALNHSTTLEKKGITPYKRSEKSEGSDLLKLSVKDLTEAIKDITDVTVLEAYLEEEQAKDEPRSTAVKAFEDRIETLSNPE
ncbi:hypothetical protein [Pseudotamlana carrageenivorans]|uniref:Uncharacterized protein n=1 Tax=Pseudotamlana carrageenivorans TaxID=2069432 RepID=A0A2I7SKN1_9FLAO|nr:hypothetical protein [Tamlana carrageenivorans]AUS06476.1 hypothetical protein C1A40_13935 [Tamlana carrageenivorans]